jgi:hypothetical protein
LVAPALRRVQARLADERFVGVMSVTRKAIPAEIVMTVRAISPRSWRSEHPPPPPRNGAASMLNAAPDGHTLLFGQTGEVVVNPFWMKSLSRETGVEAE